MCEIVHRERVGSVLCTFEEVHECVKLLPWTSTMRCLCWALIGRPTGRRCAPRIVAGYKRCIPIAPRAMPHRHFAPTPRLPRSNPSTGLVRPNDPHRHRRRRHRRPQRLRRPSSVITKSRSMHHPTNCSIDWSTRSRTLATSCPLTSVPAWSKHSFSMAPVISRSLCTTPPAAARMWPSSSSHRDGVARYRRSRPWCACSPSVCAKHRERVRVHCVRGHHQCYRPAGMQRGSRDADVNERDRDE